MLNRLTIAIALCLLSSFSLAETNHNTMYKALENSANEAIILAGECSQLTFTQKTPYKSNGVYSTGNDVTAVFKIKSCDDQNDLDGNAYIIWTVTLKREDGSIMHPHEIAHFELSYECGLKKDSFIIKSNALKHAIPDLSGSCTFNFSVVGIYGLKSKSAVKSKIFNQ